MKYDLSTQAIAARVKKGAKRYDSLKPDWWEPSNVDLGLLDQSFIKHSVVGQNRKNEGRASESWNCTVLGFLNTYEAAMEGFWFTIDKDGFSRAAWDTSKENDLLTEAWKVQILARRRVKK